MADKISQIFKSEINIFPRKQSDTVTSKSITRWMLFYSNCKYGHMSNK